MLAKFTMQYPPFFVRYAMIIACGVHVAYIGGSFMGALCFTV
jgi:hypothetical protein